MFDVVLTYLLPFISGGLMGALVRYLLDRKKDKNELAIKLHEVWWSKEFVEHRDSIYTIVKDFDTEERVLSKEFLNGIRKNQKHEEYWRSFTRLVFFFQISMFTLKKT